MTHQPSHGGASKPRRRWPWYARKVHLRTIEATASFAAGQLIVVPINKDWGYAWDRPRIHSGGRQDGR